MKELYMKNYNGEKIFSLEYDKETLRDMVLDKQEEIERLNNIINKAIDYINENGITNITCIVGQKSKKTELFKDNASLYELLEILKGVDKK